jgi:superoxide dismutase, Cu-Zn family
MKSSSAALVFILLFFLLAAGASAQAPAAAQARADLKDAAGKSVGRATLREVKGGVLISVAVNDLAPGLHAIHVHETGKCEGPKFASAGGHFNPAKTKHGLKSPEGFHAGDMPDLYATKEGMARYQTLNDRITLGPGETSVFDADGSSVVIHANADDHMTDPAGNAGDRIACGVITKVTPKKK